MGSPLPRSLRDGFFDPWRSPFYVPMSLSWDELNGIGDARGELFGLACSLSTSSCFAGWSQDSVVVNMFGKLPCGDVFRMYTEPRWRLAPEIEIAFGFSGPCADCFWEFSK